MGIVEAIIILKRHLKNSRGIMTQPPLLIAIDRVLEEVQKNQSKENENNAQSTI